MEALGRRSSRYRFFSKRGTLWLSESRWRAPGVADHEGHLLRRDIFGRDYEVAFVLARRRVKHDDELSTSYTVVDFLC
jgi:hypothetical protein